MNTISRASLKLIIAAAAEGCGFTDTEKARLVQAFDFSDKVATGSYCVEGVGCPLTQAGLAGQPVAFYDDDISRLICARMEFWPKFDQAMADTYSKGQKVLEIVG